jgi:hypothetical protein
MWSRYASSLGGRSAPITASMLMTLPKLQ